MTRYHPAKRDSNGFSIVKDDCTQPKQQLDSFNIQHKQRKKRIKASYSNNVSTECHEGMNQCMTDNRSLLQAIHASPQASEIGREALVR